MKLQRGAFVLTTIMIVLSYIQWQTMSFSRASGSLECDPYAIASSGLTREFSDNVINLQPEEPIDSLIVFIEFEDRKAVEADRNKIQKVSKNVTEFYAQMSEGEIEFNWLHYQNKVSLYKDTISYNANFRGSVGVAQVIEDVQKRLKGEIYVSELDFILVVTPSTTLSNEIANTIAYLDRGEGIVNSAILASDFWKSGGEWKMLAHEIGHAFGLLDLYSADVAQLLSQGKATFFDQFVFMKSFDLMNWPGSNSPSLVMWNRFQLTPVLSHRIACFKQERKHYELVSVNSFKLGKKAVLVPLPNSRVLMIEVRDDFGIDANTGNSDIGVITYVVNLLSESGKGPIRIDCSKAINSKYSECGLKTGHSRLIEGVRVTREKSSKLEIRISVVREK